MADTVYISSKSTAEKPDGSEASPYKDIQDYLSTVEDLKSFAKILTLNEKPDEKKL